MLHLLNCNKINIVSQSDPFDFSKNGNIEKVRHNIGIIGATPLETGYADEKLLKDACRKYGIESPLIFGICSGQNGLNEIKNAPLTCKKNLVVSPAGLKAAKYLEEKFNIPYEIAFPFIPEKIMEEVKEEAKKKVNETNAATSRVLIIHTQFAANELRNRIRHLISDSEKEIDIATFFMFDNEYAESGDMRLAGEDDL